MQYSRIIDFNCKFSIYTDRSDDSEYRRNNSRPTSTVAIIDIFHLKAVLDPHKRHAGNPSAESLFLVAFFSLVLFNLLNLLDFSGSN